MTNRGNVENLKDHQFKPGDKRAIEGGKKSKRGASLKTALVNFFNDKTQEITPDAFVKACILQAMKGNAPMARLIFEVVENLAHTDGDIPDPGSMVTNYTQIVMNIRNSKGLALPDVIIDQEPNLSTATLDKHDSSTKEKNAEKADNLRKEIAARPKSLLQEIAEDEQKDENKKDE